MQPTPEQQACIDGILDAIGFPGSTSLLCGYAGTGKTFTTAQILKELSASGLNVVVATPTHKANAQITKALRAQGAEGFEPMTIHRLLSLEYAQCYNTGSEFFARTKDGEIVRRRKKKEDMFDVVIVDETSMLCEEHYRWLLEDADDVPVIFVGDDRQLAPVSDKRLCSAFHLCDYTFRLDKVMRHDGAILNLATKIRQLNFGRPRYLPAKTSESEVYVYRSQEHWLQSALEIFSTKPSMDNADYARLLCWTNKQVVRHNNLIHAIRFGEDADEYQDGMAVITHSNVENPYGGRPIYPSALDLTVDEAERTTKLVPGPEGDESWDCWKLMVRSEWEVTPQEIYAIPKELKDKWRASQNKVARLAKDSEDDSPERKAFWRLWFYRRAQFASLQPAASLTIHKSQGSTFRHVFLCNDIDNSGELLNRLAYVGVTRPSSSLHVFQP